ncbi:MAG: EAL domain-containing protein [Burkholderiaceae bacterium]|nr:EAL domain-containing protein [Burkholderiaceae bacterium]
MTETTPTAAVEQATDPDDTAVLRFAVDSLDALVAFFDTRTRRCRFANAAYASLYGLTSASIVGRSIAEIVGPAAWAEVEPHVQRCLNGERVNYLRTHPGSDGGPRMLSIVLTPYLDATGRTTGLLSVISDTTQRWEAERAVRESEERTRKFAAATEEAIVFHCNGVMIDCNDAMTRLTGYPLDEVVGRNIFDFIAPAYRSTALEYTRSASEHLYEVCILHRDGHEIPIEVMGKTMPQHGADYRIVVARDIRARKNMQEREAFLALHDALTELLNRRALLDQLSLALAQARGAQTARQKQVAVLVVNLDHFKTINDSLGHAVGDQILYELAQRLRACVAERGFIARPGGDEFVIVLPSASRSAAARLADELFPVLAQPLAVAQTSVSLSASIGISLFPDDEQTAAGLLRQAEAALRHAKESGRGNQQFSAPGMAGEAMAALQLERDLRSAVAEMQLVLHYQPVVHVATGKLAGFEALVRWQHPSRGLLEPAAFISFAETHGLITPIGRWVMLEACRQLKRWHDAGLAQVPVAVNLSAFEFRQRDVAKEIAAVLDQTGLQPRFLEIELTETALMQQSEHVLQTLQAIEALGVGIAIDDFGTGYSSLAYLKRYPIAKLKIDRSFVIDTPDSSDDVAIVTAIVDLGRSLKLRIVAEGVEQADQLALLSRLGCDLAQGYGIARPMDAAQTQAWLEQQR